VEGMKNQITGKKRGGESGKKTDEQTIN